MILGLLALAGCAHTVVFDSDPPGAAVRIDGELVGYTPVEVRVPWRPVPFKDYRVVVRLNDHRPLRTDIRDEMRLWKPAWRAAWHPIEALRGCPEPGGEPGGPLSCPDHELHYVLVRDHGPAGTWAPEDVP